MLELLDRINNGFEKMDCETRAEIGADADTDGKMLGLLLVSWIIIPLWATRILAQIVYKKIHK